MAYVALYWGVMVIGYFLATKCRNRDGQFGFLGNIMLICISLLVFLMGIRMGSNEEVISNLGTIGVQSLILTILLMAGTVIFMTLTRKILGFDKYGLLKGRKGTAEQSAVTIDSLESDIAGEEEEKPSNLMTYLIVIFVILGLLAGYFVVRTQVGDIDAFNVKLGTLMTICLSVMLFFIGFDLGLSGTVIKNLRTIGFRVLAFPVAVLIGTGIVGVVISFVFKDLSIKETLAICYGFGWYTFAPVSIANEGYVMASAISFMHNVFRELGGLVLIPILANKVGYIEVTCLPGVAGMDVGMPIVERATRQDIIVYSFAIGATESVLVPLLVPLIIGM